MAGIWVVGEIAADGSLAKISTELATLGRTLAESAGVDASGVVIGASPDAAAQDLAGYLPLALSLRDAVASQDIWNTQLNHVTTAKNPTDQRVWFDIALRGGRPKTFEELLDPQWKGKIAWRIGSASGTPLFITNLRLAWGEEKARAYFAKLREQKIVNFGRNRSWQTIRLGPRRRRLFTLAFCSLIQTYSPNRSRAFLSKASGSRRCRAASSIRLRAVSLSIFARNSSFRGSSIATCT